MSVQSFMREFREQTEPEVLNSTRTRRWRGVVIFTLDPHRKGVGLGRIESKERGHASAALDWLGHLADKHKVVMRGVIEPFGAAWLTTKQLGEWYKRHGWELTNKCYIDRNPKIQEFRERIPEARPRTRSAA